MENHVYMNDISSLMNVYLELWPVSGVHQLWNFVIFKITNLIVPVNMKPANIARQNILKTNLKHTQKLSALRSRRITTNTNLNNNRNRMLNYRIRWQIKMSSYRYFKDKSTIWSWMRD